MPQARSRKIAFVDAFAGCGGLSLGLLQAGLDGRFAIEHDKFAFATLRANLLSRGSKFRFTWPRWLPKEPITIGALLADHRSDLEATAEQIDLLVGGPPCQGFSSAGRRKHDDPRNKLFSSYLRLVDILQPKVVLIENVRGFTMDFEANAGVKNFSYKLRKKLSEEYDVFEELLGLSQFGVPQLRTRYFLLAVKPGTCTGNPFELLKSRLPSFLREMRLKAPVSSWAAISDLEVSRGGTQASVETPGFNEIKYTNPLTHFQKLMGAGKTVPTDLRLARHSTEVTERFREIIELSHAEGRLNTSISDDIRARFGLRKKALRVWTLTVLPQPSRACPTTYFTIVSHEH
jgi:DNA (cytosine-5)-methyltransferase 1